MNFQKSPFINSLTNASKEVLDEHVKKALDSSEFTVEFEKLEKERRQIEDLLREGKFSEEEKVKYDVGNSIEPTPNSLKNCQHCHVIRLHQKIRTCMYDHEILKDTKQIEQDNPFQTV